MKDKKINDSGLKEVLRPHKMDENNNETPLRWSDLKKFVNTLTPEELDQDVIVWGDEKGGGIFKIDKAECDFINPSGEGVEPVSLYENSEEDDWWKEEPISHKKGQIILQGDL